MQQNQTPYLITTRDFPFEPERLAKELNRSYIDIANSINVRTIGIFSINRQVITGESWVLAGNVRYQTLRQVYQFGAIAAGATLDIPHGIKNINQFTRIYGTVVTNIPDYRPLPYVDPTTLTTGMALLCNGTNIHIAVGATAIPVVNGIVVLEWLTAV